MSRYSGSGVHSNNDVVSPCTGRSVSAVLRSPDMTHCLQSRGGGQCGDGVLDHGEECDCGDLESCVLTSSRCVPPGLRRAETQCTVRKPSHPRTNDQCHMLGLVSCSCPQHANDVSPPACTNCCQRPGYPSNCRPAEEWILSKFDEIQHYLARLCWSTTVTSCLSSAPKYSGFLSRLSKYRSGGEGRVFCLRTGIDSNCWQLSFHCDKRTTYQDKYKMYNMFI